ncbi:MAG TPA: ABC transporter ATP-binding protein [Rhizomicrobium sp.]|jgi:cobalt/nickel transport system ATP-binding protein|nr:ABC transporter ATP-binding protein [Rhizomicrobium sp.]
MSRRSPRIALVGANGCGKTTLLRTLVGLERPAQGAVFAFGSVRTTEASFREVRAKTGFLFQDPDDQLFCATVIDDVAFGPLNLGMSQAAATARAKDTLAQLELIDLAHRVTHRLSSGEKRLVSLASVLAMKPDVLLLDEPTNALDEVHLASLTEILISLPIAMVIVSHDRNFIEKLAARAVSLYGGNLVDAEIHRHPHIHAPGHEHHDHIGSYEVTQQTRLKKVH